MVSPVERPILCALAKIVGILHPRIVMPWELHCQVLPLQRLIFNLLLDILELVLDLFNLWPT